MSAVIVPCSACPGVVWKRTGDFNRSPSKRFYCGKACAGIARRADKTAEQKRAEKAEYDARYRAEHAERIRRGKAEWHAANYDADKARLVRDANAERIREYRASYMRTPEYRAAKAEYDKRLRGSAFGDFAECHAILLALQSEVRRREPSSYLRAKARGRYDRQCQTRKRENVQTA